MEAWNAKHKRQADIGTVSALIALKSEAVEEKLGTGKKTLERVETLSEADSAAGHLTSNPLNDSVSTALSIFQDGVRGEVERLETKLARLERAKHSVAQMSNVELQKYISGLK